MGITDLPELGHLVPREAESECRNLVSQTTVMSGYNRTHTYTRRACRPHTSRLNPVHTGTAACFTSVGQQKGTGLDIVSLFPEHLKAKAFKPQVLNHSKSNA